MPRRASGRRSSGPAVPAKLARVRIANDPISILRYTYYGFIFALPFESAGITVSGLHLAKFLGLILVGTAALQARKFLALPPKAFFCFGLYWVVSALLGLLALIDEPHNRLLASAMATQLFTLLQLLVFFWISYNLMKSEQVAKETFFTLALSCLSLAVLQAFGVTATQVTQDRLSAFGENPNLLAKVMSLGLLSLVGLAYGRQQMNRKLRLLAWGSSAVMLGAIVRTGSRGDALALVLAVAALVIRPKDIREKMRAAMMVLLVVAGLAWASYQIDAVRERWERTFYEGDVAGRDAIYSTAWDMFLERPIAGWGPVIHYHELGARLGRTARDPHNSYLWVMLETGLMGALPFFSGLWLCWLAAWRARQTNQGTLPMVLLFFCLLISLKGTWITQKLLWVILASALASRAYPMRRVLNRWHATPFTGRMRARGDCVASVPQ